MATTVEVVAGVKVTRPDFWVARVNLLGVRCDEDADEFFELLEHLRNSQIPTVQATLGGVIADAKSRYKASGVGSQEKKYINVAMGRKNDKGLNQIAKELDTLGFEVSIIPGPLLLATTGGKYGKVKTMPLSSSTTFTPTKEILTEAWKAVCCDPHDPDPDLEIPQGQEPKWSTHSLRRLADTVARRYREVTGVTEDEIDLYFGWNERVLKKVLTSPPDLLCMQNTRLTLLEAVGSGKSGLQCRAVGSGTRLRSWRSSVQLPSLRQPPKALSYRGRCTPASRAQDICMSRSRRELRLDAVATKSPRRTSSKPQKPKEISTPPKRRRWWLHVSSPAAMSTRASCDAVAT